LKIELRPIEYQHDSEPFEGLLAWDSDARSARPGILVAHTIRGRTEFEEEKARKLAELGYVAFAADMYGKDRIGSDLDDCARMMEALKADRPLLQERLHQALDTMAGQPEVDLDRLAAIGYCFGGLCALDIARTRNDVSGVASFHGLLSAPGNTASNQVASRILVLHGWDDPLAQPEEVMALGQELSGLGADWQLHAYGNVRHAFTNPAADASNGVTVYNAAADRRSWLAMQNFLSELFDT
jgi:dienelactone hydrolase